MHTNVDDLTEQVEGQMIVVKDQIENIYTKIEESETAIYCSLSDRVAGLQSHGESSPLLDLLSLNTSQTSIENLATIEAAMK